MGVEPQLQILRHLLLEQILFLVHIPQLVVAEGDRIQTLQITSAEMVAAAEEATEATLEA